MAFPICLINDSECGALQRGSGWRVKCDLSQRISPDFSFHTAVARQTRAVVCRDHQGCYRAEPGTQFYCRQYCNTIDTVEVGSNK